MKRPWRFIRRWGTLGNFVDGDCTVAAYYHCVMALNVLNGSTFKRILYRLGFKVPGDKFALAKYTEYLATLNEKPSAETGVAPDGWLNWIKAQGQIFDWLQLPVQQGPLLLETTLRSALDNFGAVMLVGQLSLNNYNNYGPRFVWKYGPEPQYQPDPSLGHAMAYLDYTQNTDLAVTWGQWQPMTITCREKCWNYAYVFVHKDDPNAQEKLTLLNSMKGK